MLCNIEIGLELGAVLVATGVHTEPWESILVYSRT
jgi:hypothetical protein